MKNEPSSRVSIRDIAQAAGISKSAVGYALQNHPGVSKATRVRILRLAERLGYVPDPRLTSWMKVMRETKFKDLLPIAWLNSKPERDTWDKVKYLSPYIEGARARALELGYRIEEIWTRAPGMTMSRISQIIEQRGIEGVIVSQPAIHIRLNWDHLAGVSIDGSLVAPGLHRVMSDMTHNLLLALKTLRRIGYRRIGICLDEDVDRYSNHSCRAAATYYHVTTPKSDRITPLFYPRRVQRGEWDDQIVDWLRRHKPDAVIGLDNRLIQWIEMAGCRVPDEIGVVHLALDDDVSDWAGIYSNKRIIGRAAVEWVISLMQNRQFGLPDLAFNTLIRGTWRPWSHPC